MAHAPFIVLSNRLCVVTAGMCERVHDALRVVFCRLCVRGCGWTSRMIACRSLVRGSALCPCRVTFQPVFRMCDFRAELLLCGFGGGAARLDKLVRVLHAHGYNQLLELEARHV
jgi:hypothetical protein